MGKVASLAVFSYNTSPHSLKISPIHRFVWKNSPKLRVGNGHTLANSLEQQLIERDATLDDLQANLF